ncbi:MAG: PrsW family glutamic-type intramembrane protease [Halieaceae bacterium]
MTFMSLAPLLVALLPALVFLGALVYFDSYKLVGLRWVMITIVVGGLCAGASYFVNQLAGESMGVTRVILSRYIAPVIEEVIKALILVYLLRSNRIGFLVDAAIFGFAVGTGFAIVENLYYLQVQADAHMGVWIVRGFGTAIMHGGVTAMFAVIAQSLSETRQNVAVMDLLPGLLIAVLTHSIYNHFFLSPILSTLLIVAVLPVVSYVVIQQSRQSVSNWLDVGFDGDTELLEILNSGEFSSSHIGQYLTSLQGRFPGEIVVDMLCYLRLHKELALRAKGMLLMRENGIEVEIDDDVRDVLKEMKALQKSIGKTGQAAIQPFLRMSRKDLWQIYMLKT